MKLWGFDVHWEKKLILKDGAYLWVSFQGNSAALGALAGTADGRRALALGSHRLALLPIARASDLSGAESGLSGKAVRPSVQTEAHLRTTQADT